MRSFLDIKNLSKEELIEILSIADQWKKQTPPKFLKDKHVMLLFEKPSLRTRVSFEVGIKQLGGSINILNATEFKLGERETIYDTAKVLERYVDLIVIRSFSHNLLNEFASLTKIPVINALTDHSHPCQVLADLLTIQEYFNTLKQLKISWFGDLNNVALSWIEASVLLGLELFIACPKKITIKESLINWIKKNNGKIHISDNVDEAAKGADCIITDTWVSMGDDQDKPIDIFKKFQVNANIMSKTKQNSIFLHCLPAYRNMEVSKDVIDGPQSVVFSQAENRLHVQKAILYYCLKNS